VEYIYKSVSLLISIIRRRGNSARGCIYRKHITNAILNPSDQHRSLIRIERESDSLW